MELDEPKLYSDLIMSYRQRLDVAIFDLERSNAQSAQKDQRIAELTRELESVRTPAAPKPGPPAN